MSGYIYIRTHISYDEHNAYKLGKTKNLKERDSTYITGEIKRGKFIRVIQFEDKNVIDKVEIQLISYFKSQNLHIFVDAGTEFFNKKILELIEPFLNDNNYTFKVLTEEEIDNICYNDKPTANTNPILTPREDQIHIVNTTVDYFNKHDKGLLVLTCGMGKTLMSLWTAQKLNFTKLLIGVPNKLLVSQWNEEVKRIFPNFNILMVKDDIRVDNISSFLSTNDKNCIVITTYSSCYKILNACNQINYTFNIKIQDECHHLTSSCMKESGTTKTFVEMLNIPSNKQLSLTATMKSLEPESDDMDVISNDNVKLFGEIIIRRNLFYAIQNKILCDYDIQTIINTSNDIDTDITDKNLFNAALTALKSINDRTSHHLLIYTNNKDNSSKIINILENLIESNRFENINDIYCESYTSNLNFKTQQNIINRFKESKIGILSCVYCLGEGWDFPLLDGVVIAENMTANIRIIQSVLRPCRLNRNETNKKAKIIIPICFDDVVNDWLNESNQNFYKVRDIIYELGLEDESIMTKVKVFIDNKSNNDSLGNKNTSESMYYDENLTEQIKLKTISRYSLNNITYEKAKSIISNYNINFITKDDYYKLCDRDIRLPREPHIMFKNKFNWIDYLNIKGDYYTFDECIKMVNFYLDKNQGLKKYYLNIYELSKILNEMDNKFPPYDFWLEYYQVKKLNQIISIKKDIKLIFKK